MTPDDEYVSMLPTCTNTDSIFAWVNDGGVYKVSGDNLNDSDYTNDNAVRMEESETYQAGQTYRADIYFSTTNKNYTTYFAKNVTLVVNGETCHIETLSGGSNLEGQTNAKAYYYFTPLPERETISMVYIEGIEQPVGHTKPVTSIDVTVGDGSGEVYVSRLKWFYDVNNNGKLDSGEDSASYFNDDGSFVTKRKYSVYIELEACDRDGDGESDYIIIPDDVGIFIANGNYIYEMTGNKNGAVYTFAEATAPAKAVKANPVKLVFDLAEGYGSTPKTITFTSVGTTKITTVNAQSAETNLINVTSSGMMATVTPVNGLAKGTYITYVQLLDESSNVWYTVPVTINVGEKINTEGISVFGDVNVTLEETDTNIYTGRVDLQAGTYNFNLNNNGTTLGFKKSFTDAETVDYSGGYKAQTTLVATGGRYTFIYNATSKRLTINHKPFADIVELFGDINVELVRTSSTSTIYTGSARIDAGTYKFRINDQGVQKCFGYTFEDSVNNITYNASWTAATTFNATGGIYSVVYDLAKSQLTFKHAPKGLGDVRIFGDITLPLAKQGNNVYSAQTTLEAGTYQFRVDSLRTTVCNGSKFTDVMGGVEYKSSWKAATTFVVTKKQKFTFIFDANTNRLKVYNSPIDTTKVLVAFEDSPLELKSTDSVNYTATTSLAAGTYTFRMDEFGVTLGFGGTYTDIISGIKYNASYSSATTFKATGGNYAFTYNVNTDVLKVTKV